MKLYVSALCDDQLKLHEIILSSLQLRRGVFDAVTFLCYLRNIVSLVEDDDGVVEVLVEHDSVLSMCQVVIRQEYDMSVFDHLSSEVERAQVFLYSFSELIQS